MVEFAGVNTLLLSCLVRHFLSVKPCIVLGVLDFLDIAIVMNELHKERFASVDPLLLSLFVSVDVEVHRHWAVGEAEALNPSSRRFGRDPGGCLQERLVIDDVCGRESPHGRVLVKDCQVQIFGELAIQSLHVA